MNDKKFILTEEGLRAREDELRELITTGRTEIAKKIAEARSQGDLSENAEYDAAMEEQAELEAKIATLEKMIKNVTIIKEDEISSDIVSIGSKVEIYDRKFEEVLVYSIVGSAEADPINGKISNESPVGKAMIGHRVGEAIPVLTPDGEVIYEVRSIKK